MVDGYRSFSTIGPLLLLQTIAGLAAHSSSNVEAAAIVVLLTAALLGLRHWTESAR